jgi:hypothetical protein
MSGVPSETRAAIEKAIESLIAVLDAMDGDPDLEPEEDRCAAYDDNPRPLPIPFACWGPGDPDDAEPDQDC